MNIVQREEVIPLTPQTQGLLVALTRGPMTPYEAAAWARLDSHNLLTLSKGSVYKTFDGLKLAGWVVVEPINDARPGRNATVYVLTDLGCQVLLWEVDRQQSLAQQVHERLGSNERADIFTG